jgi:hypothetical protein
MADITPNNLRGILIPKAQITKDNIWIGESSFTQANPRAGIPAPKQKNTGLVLSCVGSQEDIINIETQTGGLPGSAGFVWSGSDNIELGKNHSNIITDSKYFGYSVNPGYRNCDAIGDNLGNLYIVNEIIFGTGLHTINLLKQERNGAMIQKKVFFSGVVTTDTEARPMIVQLSDGSVLVSYFDYTEEDYINMVVWRSYDQAETWTKISSRALVGPYRVFIGTTGPFYGKELGKTNLITVNNNVVLVMELIGQGAGGINSSISFVSRDQGTTFRAVTQNSSKNYHEISAVALDDGQYSVTYISGTQELKNMIVPDVSISFGGDFETEKSVQISNGLLNFCSSGTNAQGGTILEDGSMTSWFQDGRIYVAAKLTDNNIIGFVSSDLGQNWEYIAGDEPGTTSGKIYRAESPSSIDRLKSCLWEGYAILLGQTNNSILGIYLGGYSSVTYPPLVNQPDFYQYLYYVTSWLAHFEPQDSTLWTTTGAGAKSLTSTGLRLQTSSNTRYFTLAGGASTTPSQTIRFKLKVDSGGSSSSDEVAMIKNADTGATAWTVRIRFSATGFVVRDHGTNLHTQAVSMTNFVEFMVSTNQEKCKVFWRTWDEKQAKKWNKISVTLGAQGTGAGNSLEWGNIASSTSDSRWTEFHLGLGSTKGIIDDSSIRSATYPPFSSYVYIDQGLNLTAKESPAREGDQYQIEPRYDFPIQNVFHQVASSPRIVWRSKNDTANQTIGVLMDATIGANEPSLALNDVGGLHLSNINFESFILQFWDIGTIAWTDHLSVNVSDGLTGTFERKGSTIQPNALGNSFYLHYGECKGWRAQLGTGDNAKIVKLKTNSEGVWGNNSTHKRAVIMIDSSLVDVTTLPTSGDFKLIPDSITITTELLQNIKLGEEAFAIKIPIQDTLEGYFQIGTMIWGHVAFMAPQYQRGRSISYEPNTQGNTTLDNTFHSRRLSDGSRTFQVAWTEPVDTRNIMSRTPDYWQLSSTVGSQPVANYGDSPFQMMGIWDQLGNQYPAVYLPSIAKGIDNQIFNRFHEHALIRPTGALTIESVLGEEEEDEMFRIANITLVEIE